MQRLCSLIYILYSVKVIFQYKRRKEYGSISNIKTLLSFSWWVQIGLVLLLFVVALSVIIPWKYLTYD